MRVNALHNGALQSLHSRYKFDDDNYSVGLPTFPRYYILKRNVILIAINNCVKVDFIDNDISKELCSHIFNFTSPGKRIILSEGI